MKLFLTALMMLLAIYIRAQNSTQYVIKKCITDKSFQAAEGIICSDEIRMTWFMILPNYSPNKEYPIPEGFFVIKSGIGDCSKNDLLVITFNDRSRIILRSANYDLECSTWIKFNANVSDMKFLEWKSVDSIRYVNGNELKSFTYYMKTDKEKDFFVNVYTNFIIKPDYCK